mgnify:CR=1 FL=1
MVDEVNLLFDRLQGVIQDALEVIESTVNAEKIAQLRALRVTVTGLEKGNIPVPSALADLVAELEQTEKEQAVAQATLEACRGRLAGINDLLGKLRPASYTHPRAHETVLDLVCRLLLVKKKQYTQS